MDLKGVLQKKVAGIPVMYIAVVFVGIFAFVAWKIKATPDTSVDTTDASATDGTTDSGGDLAGVTTGDNAGSVYDSLKTAGTVVVAPSTDTTDTTTTVKTNATWLQDGVTWLVANDKATGTLANSALSKYLNSQDRSYEEEDLVNLWIKQGGPPPDGVDPGGAVGNKPAQKQGNPPLTHEVKGASDNGYNQLAVLYYGHGDQQAYDLIQAANVDKLGPSGPFAVGTKIVVPAFHAPKYYTLTKDMTNKQIAAANGISAAQFEALNNTGSKTQFKKGNTVRVA